MFFFKITLVFPKLNYVSKSKRKELLRKHLIVLKIQTKRFTEAVPQACSS